LKRNGVIIGIDPGISGAAIAIDKNNNIVGTTVLPHVKEVPCYRSNKKRSNFNCSKFFEWLSNFDGQVDLICIEESPSYGMGVTSAYTSGINNGKLHSTCELFSATQYCGIMFVAPKVWQKTLFESQVKDGWSKSLSIEMAQLEHGDEEFFKSPKKYADGHADACHIAKFASTVYEDYIKQLEKKDLEKM